MSDNLWNRERVIDPRIDTSIDGASRIAARKSVWMKLYIEERRRKGRLKQYFRRKHFQHKEQNNETA